MAELQPWGYIGFDQFKFLNNIIGSSEWADLTQKYNEDELQDLLEWTWHLMHDKGKTQNEAISELFTYPFNFKQVQRYIDQKTNNPQQFVVNVGDQVFLKNDYGVRKIKITKVTVDFACPYGGSYPINLEFFEIGNHGAAGELDDIWVNAFGYSDNQNNARIISGKEQLSDEQLQNIRQTFVETLFIHESWTQVIKCRPENADRIKLTNTLFDKFVKSVKAKQLSKVAEIEPMIPEFINQEIPALI